ncbi:MAG: hypothetical protein IT289_08620 [Oligoflexia bacterium]|nr:hypothetical protein [Oligoflexia bacterium]
MFSILFTWLFATPAYASQNVVLITLDGVRHQESPLSPSGKLCWPRLRQALTNQTVLEASPYSQMQISASNAELISLPAYQNIFVGHPTTCLTNQCGQVQESTFIDALIDKLTIQPSGIAIVASWSEIAKAVSKRYAELITLDVPTDVRSDQDSVARAKTLIGTHDYRFFYLSLNDSDERAHLGDWPGYLQAIQNYDRWITDIMTLARGLGPNWTFFITTDHGRGDGKRWTDHGAEVPESADLWLIVTSFKPDTYWQWPISIAKPMTHDHLRPMIEFFFKSTDQNQNKRTIL